MLPRCSQGERSTGAGSSCPGTTLPKSWQLRMVHWALGITP